MTYSMMLADPEPDTISLTSLFAAKEPSSAAEGEKSSDIVVDFIRGRILRGGIPTGLTYKELQLLRYLIANHDVVVSRQDLLSNVWGYRSTTTRTVDVHMAALRRKLEDDPRSPRYIMTVRGAGYKLCANLRTLNAESNGLGNGVAAAPGSPKNSLL